MPHKNQALIEAMEANGFDVRDLANKVGVSQPTIYNWIKGAMPQNAHRAKLAELLGIEIEQLGEPNDVEPHKNGVELPENGPIAIRITGEGLLLEMQVSRETARKVLYQLLN